MYPTSHSSALSQVREGMAVYDFDGRKVGTVEFVRMGDERPGTPQVDTVTAPNYDDRRDTLVNTVADALVGDDEIPDAMEAQLLRYGYIRINTGLLSQDHFASGDMVAQVNGDQVILNVTRDELIRP